MILDFRSLQRGSLVAAICALSACGGGGGGGDGGLVFVAEPRPEPAELAPAADASTFETPEFNRNYGLDMIGAQYAYAQGATGAGVIVAVIDTGIDTSHPEFAANLSTASIDIVEPLVPLTDSDGHGTLVAGVIAAAKNDNDPGMHGVAFDATILAIGADDGSGFYTDGDIAEAIEYAIANLAHVINMSLGGEARDSRALRQWQINATQAGVILVSAAGNARTPEPGTGVQPEYPAANAGDPAFNGLALAVGAVGPFGPNGEDPELAWFSNYCGASRNFCLVAPGVAIDTTAPGNSTTTVNGTSFSAPHVTGAAALLIQLFPNLSPQEVVQILLRSADDLGRPGVDRVYGHGLLNVGAAAAPLGALSVPLADRAAGEAADLSNTRLALGPAFGDALSGVAALRNAVAVDEFQRPYAVDLSASVASAQRGFRLADLLATGASDIVSVPPAAGMTLHMALAEDPNGDPRAQSGRSRSGGEVEAASLTGSLSPGTAWHLGMGLSADGQLGRGSTTSAAGSLFWAAGELTEPHYTLLGGGDGVRLDRSLTAATTLSFGWFESDPTGNLDTGAGWGGGNIAQATVDQAFAKGGRLRLDVARVEESDTFLGSRTDGAFGSSAGAASHFVTVSGGLPVSRTIELIGSATTATTDVENAGLLSGWGTVRSTAFGIGVVARDVFDSGDRIGVLAGQPLRVGQADATVTVPVGMTADEVMVRESQRVDLAPSGREMNVQLAYRRGLWDGADLSSWLLIRNEPGHDAAASNDYGLGLSFTTTF